MSGAALLIFVCLTGVSVPTIRVSSTRLERLHELARSLTAARDKRPDLLVMEQNRLDLRTGLVPRH